MLLIPCVLSVWWNGDLKKRKTMCTRIIKKICNSAPESAFIYLVSLHISQHLHFHTNTTITWLLQYPFIFLRNNFHFLNSFDLLSAFNVFNAPDSLKVHLEVSVISIHTAFGHHYSCWITSTLKPNSDQWFATRNNNVFNMALTWIFFKSICF